jgi:hypothetical protein
MSVENQVRVLTWTTFLLWGSIIASMFWDMTLLQLLLGFVLEEKAVVWTLVRIALLILIPIAYFFAVRRIQWNLPPEEHVTDRMNIDNT